MAERCCWVRVGRAKELVFIPGCMGGAASGPDRCTCATLEEQIEMLGKRIARLEVIESYLSKQGIDFSAIAQQETREKMCDRHQLRLLEKDNTQ